MTLIHALAVCSQILLELEQDEDILHDDLADLLTEDAGDLHPTGHSKGQGNGKFHLKLKPVKTNHATIPNFHTHT